MTVITSPDVLTQDILDRCARRAADYDRENRFFHEDFEELRASGYLLMAVPGGARWPRPLARRGVPRDGAGSPTTRRQPRSPPTCTSTGPASPPTSTAAATARSPGCSRRPPRARCSPPATARPATTCRCCCRRRKAEPVDGGYRFTGHKMFGRSARCGPGSASTRWTRAIPPTRRSCTRSCRGRPRATSSTRRGTRSACGRRAATTRMLDGAFVPDRYIARVVPAGFAGADMFVLGIFAWAEPTFSSVYLGDRPARDRPRRRRARRSARRSHSAVRRWRTTRCSSTRSRRWRSTLEGALPHVEKTADDWSNGVDHGGLWPAKLVATKYHAVEGRQARRRPGDGGVGRERHVPFERARAAVPRRAVRRLPPGERRARARDRRQDRARRARRAAALVVAARFRGRLDRGPGTELHAG